MGGGTVDNAITSVSFTSSEFTLSLSSGGSYSSSYGAGTNQDGSISIFSFSTFVGENEVYILNDMDVNSLEVLEVDYDDVSFVQYLAEFN